MHSKKREHPSKSPSPTPTIQKDVNLDSNSPKRPRTKNNEPPTLQNLKLYIIQAKLSPSSIEELIELAENEGAVICSDPRDADVLLTNIGMRKRLERHVSWQVACLKSVVKPDWLRDSVRAGRILPCGKYAAIQSLIEEAVRNCPNGDECLGCDVCNRRLSTSSTGTSTVVLKSVHHTPQYDIVSRTGVVLKPYDAPTSPKATYNATYSCERAAPLVCPNEGLVRALAVIRKSRELESEGRSSLSYQRAIATVKAYPHKISDKNISEVVKLPYLGQKIGAMVREFHESGRIAAADEIANSQRFAALSTLASIHGIGPVTARKLYDVGVHSLEDARVYYGVDKNDTLDREDENSENYQVKVGLALAEELADKIPRNEVEDIARCVYDVLCEIEEGFVYTICGGHRRGKPASNDVDIVFTHPEPGKEVGVCAKLVHRLRERGLLTHLLHLSGPITHKPSSLPHSTHKGWDSLEKALTVMQLPDPRSGEDSPNNHDEKRTGVHRRVDLIFAPINVYWCAVVGWTGSTMFERDLRVYTKAKKGWKFDSSGTIRLSDSSLVRCNSEAELFELCGLPWIPPEFRNADYSG